MLPERYINIALYSYNQAIIWVLALCTLFFFSCVKLGNKLGAWYRWYSALLQSIALYYCVLNAFLFFFFSCSIMRCPMGWTLKCINRYVIFSDPIFFSLCIAWVSFVWLFLLYKTNSSGQKDENHMEGFLQILQRVRAQKHASIQFE